MWWRWRRAEAHTNGSAGDAAGPPDGADESSVRPALNEVEQERPLLMAIAGVGLQTATAVVTAVGDAAEFRNGREMAAWLVPRQRSTGLGRAA